MTLGVKFAQKTGNRLHTSKRTGIKSSIEQSLSNKKTMSFSKGAMEKNKLVVWFFQGIKSYPVTCRFHESLFQDPRIHQDFMECND